MAAKDGTTNCHRYCTAYVVSNKKPVTLAMTYVRNDVDEAEVLADLTCDGGNRDNGWMAQPVVRLFDKSTNRGRPQEQVSQKP